MIIMIKIMKNIHIIPTQNNKSKLAVYHYEGSKNIKIGELGLQINNTIGWTNYWSPRELNITSDEEIKKGDWYFTLDSKRVDKSIGVLDGFSPIHKKIILTTDQDLIADGVQAIDDEFLEWFAKNLSCEVVEVNWVKTPDGIFYHQENVPYGCYKIIIPKEELTKDEIDKFFVDMVCNPKEPKQETLEEAAEREYPHSLYENDWNALQNRKRKEFIKGAKSDAAKSYWYSIFKQNPQSAKCRQERMYSEEEVKTIINDIVEKHCTYFRQETKDSVKLEWFKKFKK